MTSVTSLSGYSYSASYKSSLDKNGDGVVSADELPSSQTSSGSSTSTAASASSSSSILSTGEVAGTSALDRLSTLINSILMQMTSGESQPRPEDKGDFFTSLDADGDGVLTEAEFATGKPEEVSDDQSASLFTRLDANGDGSVSTEEFAAMRPEGPPPPPPSGDAATGDDSETSLTDLLEQLKSVISNYLENLDDTGEEQTVLLTA